MSTLSVEFRCKACGFTSDTGFVVKGDTAKPLSEWECTVERPNHGPAAPAEMRGTALAVN